jgi:hypothetical protein
MRTQLMELGQIPPSLSDCPLDFNDFPSIVHTSFEIFNQLPDKFLPRAEGGTPYYSGKEMTALPMLLDMHIITDTVDKLLVLEFINMLDIRAKKDLNKPRK